MIHHYHQLSLIIIDYHHLSLIIDNAIWRMLSKSFWGFDPNAYRKYQTMFRLSVGRNWGQGLYRSTRCWKDWALAKNQDTRVVTSRLLPWLYVCIHYVCIYIYMLYIHTYIYICYTYIYIYIWVIHPRWGTLDSQVINWLIGFMEDNWFMGASSCRELIKLLPSSALRSSNVAGWTIPELNWSL